MAAPINGMTVLNNIKAAVVVAVLFVTAVDSHEDIYAVSNTFHGVDVSTIMFDVSYDSSSQAKPFI